MTFAQIINNIIEQYPVSERELRNQFTVCALPADLSACDYIRQAGWVMVQEAPKPKINAITQTTYEEGPDLIDGVWVQVWRIVDLDAETVAANVASMQSSLYAELDAAVSGHLDAKAAELGYENRLSICTYVNSTIPKFAHESAAFIAWRDQVWSMCLQILSDVSNGLRQPPNATQLISELPEFTL